MAISNVDPMGGGPVGRYRGVSIHSGLSMQGTCGHERWLPADLLRILPVVCQRTGCDDWRLMRRSLQRRDGWVHFLRSDRFRIPGLVLKSYRRDAMAGQFAKNFHRRSMRCHEASTPEFGVPEPVLFLEDENVVAMEYVEAPSAAARIFRATFAPEIRRVVVRKSARWLDWYHRQGAVETLPFDASMMMSWIEKLRRAVPGGRLAGDCLLNDCLRISEQLAAETHGKPMRHGMAHGDFTPANLFIHGGRTIGFDYWANGRQPLYHEISRFFVYLEVYRLIPSDGADLAKYGCCRADFEAFIGGLSGAESWDDNLWLRLHFMEITRRILSLTIPHRRWQGRVVRSVQATILRRNARKMLHALG